MGLQGSLRLARVGLLFLAGVSSAIQGWAAGEAENRTAQQILPATVNLSLSSRSVVKNILSPTANLAEQLANLPAAGAGLSESGYTVQLGAFKGEVAMHEFADNHGLRELENLLGHRVRVEGRTWFVITWGEFASAEKAEQAWLEQQESFPGVEHWVRSMESLNRVKVASD